MQGKEYTWIVDGECSHCSTGKITCGNLSSGVYDLSSLAKYCPAQVPIHTLLVLWGACASSTFQTVFTLQKQTNSHNVSKRVLQTLVFSILTLSWKFYILETTNVCMSKYVSTTDNETRDNTRDRNKFRTGRHRTEHCIFTNRLTITIKITLTPKMFKSRIKSVY